MLQEVDSHVKAATRKCKGLGAVVVSHTAALQDEKGEESVESKSLKHMYLDISFSAVDFKDPLADDSSVFRKDSQSPPC